MLSLVLPLAFKKLNALFLWSPLPDFCDSLVFALLYGILMFPSNWLAEAIKPMKTMTAIVSLVIGIPGIALVFVITLQIAEQVGFMNWDLHFVSGILIFFATLVTLLLAGLIAVGAGGLGWLATHIIYQRVRKIVAPASPTEDKEMD